MGSKVNQRKWSRGKMGSSMAWKWAVVNSPDFYYVSWPRFATLCASLPFWPNFCKMRYLSGRLANWRKLKHFDEVLEEENADKSFIHLPRQDLNWPKEIAETSHFLAREYLIYTLFTPFDLRLYSLLKESVYEMIKILFVCWGKRFQ